MTQLFKTSSAEEEIKNVEVWDSTNPLTEEKSQEKCL
jgi:hypothetical protein